MQNWLQSTSNPSVQPCRFVVALRGTTTWSGGVFLTLVFHGIPSLSPLSTGRWGIKPAIITRRLAVRRRNVFMVLPRGQLISIRYCGFIACCLPQGPLIDPVFLDRVFPSKVCLSSERTSVPVAFVMPWNLVLFTG